MKPRTYVMLALFGLVGFFAIVNWRSFSAPTSLDLLVVDVQAPLGIIMLFILGIVAVVFFLLLAKVEIAMLWETRKYSKEMESARKMADEAEFSRIDDLRVSLHSELAEIKNKLDTLIGKPDA